MEHKQKSPSYQFYPNDWLNDVNLQSNPPYVIGLWINILCVMHSCTPYGYLAMGDEPMSMNLISKLVKMSPRTCQEGIKKLLSSGVLRRDDKGRFYSKRMVADEDLRSIRRAAGVKGGNPKLKVLVNQNPTTHLNQNPTPSSSSSISSSKVLSSKVNKPSVVIIATGNESETYNTARRECEIVGIELAIPYQFFKKYESEYEPKSILEAIRATASYALSKGNKTITYSNVQRFLQDQPMKQYNPKEDSEAARKARERALDPNEAKRKKEEWAKFRELNQQSITKQT